MQKTSIVCAHACRDRQTGQTTKQKHKQPERAPTQPSRPRNAETPERRSHLRRLVNGRHLGPDAERDVLVLGVAPVQVSEVLAPRPSPEVEEAVGDRVVLEHDVVHVPVLLQSQQRAP